MNELLAAWNRVLRDSGIPLEFVGFVGSTGNYLLTSGEALSVQAVSRVVKESLGGLPGVHAARPFAVFAAEDFAAWVGALHVSPDSPPAAELGRTPTRGLVMDCNPEDEAPPKPTARTKLAFGEFARARVREAWKMDLLTADGKKKRKDPPGREGGWGIVAEAMNDVRPGNWTARSLETIDRMSRRLGVAAQTAPSYPPSGPLMSVTAPVTVTGQTDPRAQMRELLRGSALETVGRAFLESSTPLDLAIHGRRVAESAIRMLGARHGVIVEGRTFFEVLSDVAARNLVSERVAVYVHALRRLGNAALHGSGGASPVTLGEEDGQLINRMLMLILRETLSGSS
jgi:hypothetical protein